MISESEEGTEWERVLWKPNGLPDNHVPKSFLSSLSKNPNFRPYTYWSLVLLSWTVTQQLAVTLIFLATFVLLKERRLDPRLLVLISITSFVSGYVVWDILYRYTGTTIRHTDRAKAVKSSILVFLALVALSPVLRTMTAATSSDSVWALSAFLFILNILLADYRSMDNKGPLRESLTSVLSMNAAISASVVLASRLADDISVFALMLFSVQSFALFPILRRRLQDIPQSIPILLTACLSCISLWLIAGLSPSITYMCATLFLFVSFVAPGLFTWAQKYKNEIRGTWDPAVPKVKQAHI